MTDHTQDSNASVLTERRDYRWLKASDGHMSGMDCMRCDYNVHVALLGGRSDRERIIKAMDLMLVHYVRTHSVAGSVPSAQRCTGETDVVSALDRWQAKCSCGWRGQPHYGYALACADADEHSPNSGVRQRDVITSTEPIELTAWEVRALTAYEIGKVGHRLSYSDACEEYGSVCWIHGHSTEGCKSDPSRCTYHVDVEEIRRRIA